MRRFSGNVGGMVEVPDGESRRTGGSKTWHHRMGCLKDTETCATCIEVGVRKDAIVYLVIRVTMVKVSDRLIAK